jgi:glycosyltransferase involved in cell wall biosynthesis
MQHVFPRIRAAEPRVRLVVIGSDPPPRHSLPEGDAVDLIGFVEDVREPLARYSIFVCPILSGSGVRVKLLEAFAAGIPVVSTRLGAEGLASVDGDICVLADDPESFARGVIDLVKNPDEATNLSRRARAYVVENRDMRAITARLVDSYRAEIQRMRNRP